MAQLIALYKTPKDPKAFDAYYFSTHVPLAKKIPGLQKYEVSDGGVGGPGGGAYHLVALLSFKSAADIGAGLGAPDGQAISAISPTAAWSFWCLTPRHCDTPTPVSLPEPVPSPPGRGKGR